jgi:hypothetical protein
MVYIHRRNPFYNPQSKNRKTNCNIVGLGLSTLFLMVLALETLLNSAAYLQIIANYLSASP